MHKFFREPRHTTLSFLAKTVFLNSLTNWESCECVRLQKKTLKPPCSSSEQSFSSSSSSDELLSKPRAGFLLELPPPGDDSSWLSYSSNKNSWSFSSSAFSPSVKTSLACFLRENGDLVFLMLLSPLAPSASLRVKFLIQSGSSSSSFPSTLWDSSVNPEFRFSLRSVSHWRALQIMLRDFPVPKRERKRERDQTLSESTYLLLSNNWSNVEKKIYIYTSGAFEHGDASLIEKLIERIHEIDLDRVRLVWKRRELSYLRHWGRHSKGNQFRFGGFDGILPPISKKTSLFGRKNTLFYRGHWIAQPLSSNDRNKS